MNAINALENTLLVNAGKILVTNPKSAVKRSEFLKNDPDAKRLSVDPKFGELFIDDDAPKMKSVTLSKYLLRRGAFDGRILPKLPEGHTFEASQFCDVLIAELNDYEIGNGTSLVQNEFGNIFYVFDKKKTKLVVDVYIAYKRCHILVLGMESHMWGAGFAVFVPN